MRVLCIEKDATWEGTCLDGFCPKYGEVCEVIDSITDHEGHWYKIEKYQPFIWESSGFIPLSDIDEKEMEREWMLTPVELPNQVN